MKTVHAFRIRQLGFSMIELMIAITLGLILLVGVLQVFSSAREGFKTQQGSARAQESGRTGAFIISRTARLAGYWNIRLGNPERPNPYDSATLSAVSGTEGGSGPDTVSLRYESTPDGTMLDCLGAVVDCRGNTTCLGDPVSAALTMVNTFQLSAVDSATGVRSLQCRRQSTNAQPTTATVTDITTEPILEGVSDLQIVYGITAGGSTIARYVNADQVGDFRNVRSLRFTLTTNSVEAVSGTSTSDRRLTQTYSETIPLRN